MPVDYTIAARNAQSNVAPDYANMLAQYQMMGARATQNQLAQLQMQKLQQEQEQQNALRGILSQPGFDLNSPAATRALLGAGLFEEPLKLQAAQDTRALHQAARQNYESEIQARTGLTAAQIDKYGAETQKEAALARKAKLEEDAADLTKAREGASLVLSQNGKGFDKWRANLPPDLTPYAPDNFDPETMSGFATTLATHQDAIKNVNDFDYQKIKKFDGSEVIVAIPKHAPQKGAKVVPGTEGAPEQKYGFMPGPEGTGTVIRTSPTAGTAESLPLTSGIPAPRVQAPPEGKLTPRVDMSAPPGAPANVPEPVPGTPEYTNRKFANQVFKDIEYNPKTGDDRLSKLIKQSTSGGLESAAAGVSGFFGRSTPGAKAIAQIGTLVNNIVLERMNGKLGAGVSNEDREFFKSLQGNLDNPSIPVETRLAAWNEAKRRMAKYSSDFSVSAAPSAGGVIDFGDLK